MFPGLGAYAGPPPTEAPSDVPDQAYDFRNDPKFQQALEMLQEVLKQEPDPQDSKALADVIANLYQLASDRTKEQDGMLAGKISPRALRRA